nr:hypothetical protein [Candidatus Sigynarchaeum springense]
MPIVDGKYEQKISTVFATPTEAIEEIKRKLKHGRKIRISNIPMALLRALAPLLQGKDLKIVLPGGEMPPADIKIQAEFAAAKAKIYVDYKGREAASGSIGFPDIVFNIVWLKPSGEVLEITAMEYSKCVKCMVNETFDSGWHYSLKFQPEK